MYHCRDIFLPDRKFSKTMLSLAFPIALQNMMVSLLNILDIVLIQGLGDTAVASVSLANQISFIANLVVFGICSGGSIFVSQYYGKGDDAGVRRTVAMSTTLVGGVTLLIALLTMLFPDGAMRLFTDDDNLIRHGSDYLMIVAPTYLLSGISYSYSTLLRCTHRAKYPLIASVVALSMNTLLNYLLIYGIGPFPQMGIQGAAVATLISRIAEIILMLSFAYMGKDNHFRVFRTDFQQIDSAFARLFLTTAWPVILNESIWGLGISSFSMIYGRMGESAVAAMNVAGTLEQLFNVFFHGVGSAALIMIGNEIGAQQHENARLYSRRFALFGLLIGLVVMTGMLTLSDVFVSAMFRNITPQTQVLAKQAILVLGLYMPFRSVASVIIVGIMRGGGDNFHAILYDSLPIYILSIPLGILTGLVWKLPLWIVVACIMSKRIVKCVLSVRRLFSDRWVNNVC